MNNARIDMIKSYIALLYKNKITPKIIDVCRDSNRSRSDFYYYYENMSALSNDAVDYIYSIFISFCPELPAISKKSNYGRKEKLISFYNCLILFAKHETFLFKFVFGMEKFSECNLILKNLYLQFVLPLFENAEDPECQYKSMISFFGAITVVRTWVDRDLVDSQETVLGLILKSININDFISA